MPIVKRSMIVCFVLATCVTNPAFAQTCKPDQIWSHVHSAAKPDTSTDDIKGSRVTTIEVCRDELASGANLKTTVQFDGQHVGSALEQGKCLHRAAKWAIVRSIGAQTAQGTPAEAKGVFRVCKD